MSFLSYFKDIRGIKRFSLYKNLFVGPYRERFTALLDCGGRYFESEEVEDQNLHTTRNDLLTDTDKMTFLLKTKDYQTLPMRCTSKGTCIAHSVVRRARTKSWVQIGLPDFEHSLEKPAVIIT